MHSKDDEVIPYDNSMDLSLHTNSHFYEIFGSHNAPVFDDRVHDLLKKHLN